MNSAYSCYAAAAFGMEGLVARELRSLQAKEVEAENGGVRFVASGEDLFRFNMKMHFTDRLYTVLASGECHTFEELFQLVFSVNWRNYMNGEEFIDVSAKCFRSRLMSCRDIQSVTKKAILEKMKASAGQSIFPETGPHLPVLVSIRENRTAVMLNVSGDALSRRGYRTWNGEAPLRETLAAALLDVSPWKPGLPLHDPCCGTGTIPIEAAFMAAGRAPGLQRSFSMQKIKRFRDICFESLRKEAQENVNWAAVGYIGGSDADPEPLHLASRHVAQSGIPADLLSFRNVPLQELNLSMENGTFICNPPYGERMSDQKDCRALYHDLMLLKKRHPTWHLCAISSDPFFERSYGKRSDRKRRFYNGRLECTFYIYL